MSGKASDSVAIIGSGGIGGYLAARLIEAGRDVTVCVRTPFDGLTIESGGKTTTVQARIATDPATVKPVRWILLTTKSQDTASAAPWIKALAGPETVLVMVQNGIGHFERATPIAAGATIVPAIIWCSVERTKPGHIVHHGAARIAVPKGPEGDGLDQLFRDTGFTIEQAADFTTVAWRKLISNLCANALTSLTLRRTVIFQEKPILDLSRRIMEEAVLISQAEGAKLTFEDAAKVHRGLGGLGAEAGTSMLYDRLAGRELEHDYLTGAVVQAADRHGIEAPVNRTLYALLQTVSGQDLDAVK